MLYRLAKRLRPYAIVLPVILVALALFNSTLHAAPLSTGFSRALVASGFDSPTAFAFAADGRIFVTRQSGTVNVIKDNALLATPFVTLSVDSAAERGLLGITLHPDFPATPYVYVYYTVPTDPIHNRISRFTAEGDVAAANSEEILVELDNLSAIFHNGGALHFGKDGKLYVGVGDNTNAGQAKSLNSRLGKMLRYNADGTIPEDNPFYNVASGDNRAIWARGFRNPFTFAVQPTSGRIFINDVGQDTWEEINDGVAGSNYGWFTCEGFCDPPNANFRDPLLAYPHTGGDFNGCAIVGGAFYNPTIVQFPPDYVGNYFFADLCSGWIRRYDPTNNTSQEFANGISTPVDLHVSNDGTLYYLARGNGGQVWHVTYQPTATGTPTETFTPTVTHTPTITNTPTDLPTETATPTLTFTPTHPFTATRTFTPTGLFTATLTATPCPVTKAELLHPHPDATLNKVRIRLDWTDVPCAKVYRVKLQQQGGSNRQVIPVTQSQLRTDPLERGKTYKFRVVTCNELECVRSAWRIFSIAARETR